MAAQGMSQIDGGQNKHESINVGTMEGNELTKDNKSIANEIAATKKTEETTKNTKNVGDLLIAIGEIFGDELVSNQKKDIVNRGEFNNQTHTVQPDEQGTENAIENTPGRLAYVHSCSICKKSFNKKIELKEHLFVHNGDLKFKCEFGNCGWSFKSKYKLERHQSTHSANNKFICPIETCNRAFREAYKFKSHIASHTAVHQCQENNCDAVCSTLKELRNHKAKTHSQPAYKCYISECNQVFTSKLERDNHVKIHRRFVCPFPGCQKPFIRKSYLDVHARSHTNERPFKCSYQGCFATFTSSTKLNRHQNAHNSLKPFVCSFENCDSSFKRKDNLTQHINMHHRDNKFQCPFPDCNSKFTAKSSLKEHISRHTKQEVYKCPIEGCNKIYYSKKVLGTHVKRHQRKIEKEENSLQEQESRSFLIEIAPKSHDAAQHTDISVNEVLIPAKTDATGLISYGNDVTGINSENTVISLGEAVCFQYMNSADRLPVVGEQSANSAEQSTKVPASCSSNHKTINVDIKTQGSSSLPPMTPNFLEVNTVNGNNTTVNNQSFKGNILTTTFQSKTLTSNHMHTTEQATNSAVEPSSSANSLEEASKVDQSLPIFSSGSVSIPLSMTRFLPREIQINELFHSDFSDDHAYNRSLLPAATACDNRNIDNAIENALTVTEFGGPLSVSSANESIMEMRSFLVENGMASFLANDDIGRMETCTSQDNISISRTFERPRDLSTSMMLDECIINHQSGSLNTGFNHYASNDSYVSLIGSSQIVNEHLLNISSNPTMIDHMYSQHSPEEDDLQIATEDHVYEESTVNIQDIR